MFGTFLVLGKKVCPLPIQDSLLVKRRNDNHSPLNRYKIVKKNQLGLYTIFTPSNTMGLDPSFDSEFWE